MRRLQLRLSLRTRGVPGYRWQVAFGSSVSPRMTVKYEFHHSPARRAQKGLPPFSAASYFCGSLEPSLAPSTAPLVVSLVLVAAFFVPFAVAW